MDPIKSYMEGLSIIFQVYFDFLDNPFSNSSINSLFKFNRLFLRLSLWLRNMRDWFLDTSSRSGLSWLEYIICYWEWGSSDYIITVSHIYYGPLYLIPSETQVTIHNVHPNAFMKYPSYY